MRVINHILHDDFNRILIAQQRKCFRGNFGDAHSFLFFSYLIIKEYKEREEEEEKI